MSGGVQLELYLHAYEMDALSSVLKEKGATVKTQMQEYLIRLYEFYVPPDVQTEVRARIDAERAAWEAEQRAEQKYTAFCVRENGAELFFRLDSEEDFLETAKFLRRYLCGDQGPGIAALQRSAFARMEPVTAEQYAQLLALRMCIPGKVTGVFDLDFDRQEVSAVDAADGWKTYSMQDVSDAVRHAYWKDCSSLKQYTERFLDKLAGREIASAGHLSSREVSFAEEISEIDGLLNFYMETCFNADAVFGTRVCTAENDDALNVYANYDMASGQVCDELEVDLHWVDGRDEAVAYRLNPAEKAVILRKMDAYCQEQTGQTLKEYSAQRLAEDMAPPEQPVL